MQKIVSLSILTIKTLLNVCLITVHAAFRWILPKHKDISGETILITGGGRGLGRQVALQLAKHRPKHIILWGRTEHWLQKTCEDIKKEGVAASYFVCDVSDREQVYRKAKVVVEAVGEITLLINNAGVVRGGQLLEKQDEDIIQTLQTNTLAQFWTTKAFLPSMTSRNHGHIVCVSSILGLLGLKGTSDYSASKFATTGLMESLSWELESYSGIEMTIIHPYQIDNDMFAGLKLKFPKVFPPLKEGDVAIVIVKAILTSRRQLVMPAYFTPILFFRSVLPVSCLVPSLKFFGMDKAMDAIRIHSDVQTDTQTTS